MNIEKWLKANTTSLLGKTVAISGATGGLGQELCKHFAELGADLILLDRNMEKSKALASRLKAQFPSRSLSHIQVDMANIETVKTAVHRLLALPMDFLVLNAGAYSIPRHICDTGYDNVFQINFVSPYYMARKLLPHLRTRGGKLIAVGSIAHNYAKADFNDVDFSTRKKASLVYGNAKRYLMYALYGMADTQMDIAITHPGITFTNITAHYPKLIFAMIKHPMKLLFMSPRKASLCILQGLFEDCGKNEWIGPRHFDIWGFPVRKSLHTCSNTEAEQIYQTAEQIYKKVDQMDVNGI